MPPGKTPKKPRVALIQKPVRMSPVFWAKVEGAMEYDGITSFSQFALASLTQRVRRIEQQKALDEKTGGQ